MIYDITQPLFECEVFPGDPAPEKQVVMSTADGDICNLTSFAMCAHNGTHVDAPYHFLQNGKGIGEVDLEKFIGPAYVEHHDGVVTAEDAREMLAYAAIAMPGAEKRILIGGNAEVSMEAAEVFAEAGIDLIGNESQTVGPLDAPAAVHLVLLGAQVVLLEGIRLGHVPDGAYFLNCAPINLGHADGAPCRAVLVEVQE